MFKNVKNRLRSDLWLVLLDIVIVNGAYLMALLIRFYVHFKFTSGIGDFREYYLQFTPYYTVLCLFVFYLCGLYNGMWRYAGLNDMNRIIVASVITSAIHVFGTKWFVHSMPTSYYLIGGFLQFLLIAAVRFANRFLQARRQKGDKLRAWTVPAMVVGTGDTGKEFARYLEDNTPFQVAAIVGEPSGRSLDGIPIVDYASIPSQVKFHGISAVFIADDTLSPQRREEIRQAVGGAEVMDYTGYLAGLARRVPLSALLSVVEGPVTVTVDGVERAYPSLRECDCALPGSYEVKRVSGASIELRRMDAE